MGKLVDLVGKVFGRLHVIKFVGMSKHHKSIFLCKCSCGKEKEILSNSLLSGRTVSCGCYNREIITSEAHIKKLTSNNSGKNNGMYGKHHTDKVKATLSRIASKRVGELAPNYKDGRCYERVSKRLRPEYVTWRARVFERDNFTCYKCKQYGGDMRAHHIESYNNNPELRTVVCNGITLCLDCHNDFHNKYGYGNNTKEQFNNFGGE